MAVPYFAVVSDTQAVPQKHYLVRINSEGNGSTSDGSMVAVFHNSASARDARDALNGGN